MRFFIIDVEATCWEQKPTDLVQEIIEFGCTIATLPDLNRIKTHSILVKPCIHPNLSDFCTELTGITQEMIDKDGVSYYLAHEELSDMICDGDIMGSWGAFDRKIIRSNCHIHDCEYPFKTGHVNLKPMVAQLMRWESRGVGLMTAIQRLNMEFEGKWHRGVDDARNILSILKATQDHLDYNGSNNSVAKEIELWSKKGIIYDN